MQTISAHWSMVGAVVVLVAVSVALWLLIRARRQSHRLQRRFGSEYGRTVNALGSRTKAESDLRAREKRVRRITFSRLTDVDAARFAQAWNTLQAAFVDNPKGAVLQAEQLVRELMLKRGYPMGNFERRASDISVDHPALVAPYRLAQGIIARAESDAADTEDLRQALVHYRELFDDLLEVNAVEQQALRDEPVAAHA